MDGQSAGERRRGERERGGQLQLIRRQDDMFLLGNVTGERLICFCIGT